LLLANLPTNFFINYLFELIYKKIEKYTLSVVHINILSNHIFTHPSIMSVIPPPSLDLKASCEPKKYNLYTLVRDTPSTSQYKYTYYDEYQTCLTWDTGYVSEYTSSVSSDFIASCGISNDLIVTTNSLPRLNTFSNYLWIKNNKLEFIKSPHRIVSPQLPPMGGCDETRSFALYLDVIKNPSVETTTKFLNSVHILRKIETVSDPNMNGSTSTIFDVHLGADIEAITPENLAPFMEHGVLKPFKCIMHDYCLH